MRRNKTKGFTLIELMISVAILAIIIAIAVPAYNNQVQKTRRADAQAGLLNAAQILERCFTRTNTYVGCDSDVPNESPDGFYTLGFDKGPAQSSYTLQAVPQGNQASDGCKTFFLDHRGNKSNSANATADRCWGS